MKADCLTPLLTSEDKTNYVVDGITPTIVRDHKLHYPVGSGTDTYNGGNLKYLPTQIFYTKTHSAELSTNLTYEYPDSFFIIDRVKGAQEIDVKCDNTICDMYCCLIGMYYKFRDAQKNNRTLAKELETKWIRAEALRNRVFDAYQCNKAEDVSELVDEILKLGDCQPGCGCDADGDTPTLITSITSDPFTPLVTELVQQIGGSGGSGGSGEVNSGENLGAGKTVFAGKPAEDLQFKSFIAGGGIQLSETATEITITATPTSGGGTSGTTVVLAGSGISVTDTTSGTTTSYSVAVEQDLLDKIAVPVVAELTAGNNINLDETIDANGNKTYTVSTVSSAHSSLRGLYRFKVGTIVPEVETLFEYKSGDYVSDSPIFSFVSGTTILTPGSGFGSFAAASAIDLAVGLANRFAPQDQPIITPMGIYEDLTRNPSASEDYYFGQIKSLVDGGVYNVSTFYQTAEKAGLPPFSSFAVAPAKVHMNFLTKRGDFYLPSTTSVQGKYFYFTINYNK
jgi:hypothetical protein